MMLGVPRCSSFPSSRSGLSGFETGVAVDAARQGAAGRHRGGIRPGASRTRSKLLAHAALIMSVLLIGSSFVTTLLIPVEAFAKGAPRPGARSPTSRTSSSAKGSGRSTT